MQEVTIKKIKEILDLDSQLIEIQRQRAELNKKFSEMRTDYNKGIDELFSFIGKEPSIYVDDEKSYLISEAGIQEIKTIKKHE